MALKIKMIGRIGRSTVRGTIGRGCVSRRFARFNSNVPNRKEDETGLKKKEGEYIPQTQYQRVTYEYPPPPGETPFKPVEASPFRKHLPLICALGGIAWALYAYKYFISDESSDESHLDPSHFVTFKLTHKEQLTDDLMVIELSPKYETFRKVLRQKGGLWNGKKLWSVEVAQPQIQVVRRYTPLPLYYMQYKDGDETKALLRMIGSGDDEGRFSLLVKRYRDGEVSRYLCGLDLGSEVNVRGPFVGYKFPYAPIDATEPRDPMEDLPSRMLPEYPHSEGIPEPDNVAFFAGGTGIAPILQSLFSKNPPRGAVDVHYSVRDRAEIPFKRFLLFLEKTGRAKFHFYVDNENKFIAEKDVPAPIPKQMTSIDPKVEREIEHELKLKKAMEQIRKERQTADDDGSTTSQPQEEPQLAKTPTTITTAIDPVSETPTNKPTDTGVRRKYRSILEQVADTKPQHRGPAIAVVCGPEGYVSYLAGRRGPTNREPITGLLGSKGWDTTNTHRMEA